LSNSKCKCAMDNRLLVSILIIIASSISETIAVIAQLNQSNINNTILVPSPNTTDIKLSSDGNRIILTWLKMNGTDVTPSDQAAAFTIDKHDFLKEFGQLFENSNKTINLGE
jgi:hypothetical protein